MSKHFAFDNSLGSIEECLEALQHRDRQPRSTEDFMGFTSYHNFFSPRSNLSTANSERNCRCRHEKDIASLKHEMEGLKAIFMDRTENILHLEVLFKRALNQLTYEIEAIDEKRKKITQLETKVTEKISNSHIQSFHGPTCAFPVPHKNLSRSPGDFSFSNNEGEETSNFSFGEIDENIDVHLPREKDCKDFEEFLKKQQSNSLVSDKALEEHEVMQIPYVYDTRATGANLLKSLSPGEYVSERYRVETVIASTHFSTVLQCQDLFERKKVCLKMIHSQKETFDQGLDEIKIMNALQKASRGKLSQKFIVKMLEFFYYKENLYTVYELLGENLFVINSNPSYSSILKKETLIRITKQLLSALAFIHSQGIIHADIKPENILLSSPISYRRNLHQLDIRLVDFGSSCYVTDTLTTYIQSKAYRAPEVIVGGKYDSKIDIWSAGCVLAELITGEVLFSASNLKEMLTKVINN
jgi:Protein kinase domain